MIKFVSTRILACALLSGVFFNTALAQNCGTAPKQPAIPEGAKSTIDELKTSSQAVKAFIAEADTYLDCKLAARDTETENMSKKEIKLWEKDLQHLTKMRNEIGDRFNEQVQAHLKTNGK